MKKTHCFNSIGLALGAAALIALAGCATSSPQAGSAEKNAEPTYHYEPWEGDGMDIPLDGSSTEAFNTSMARVEAYTTPKEYHALKGAIDYLLLYELDVRKDMNKLIPKLDGKTPRQIIDLVFERSGARKSTL